MEGQPSVSLESRVAKVEGQLSQLVSTVESFINASDNWRNDITKALGKLTENISDKTRPNLGIMASWAAVVIAFIVAVGAPILAASRRDAERHDQGIRDLDTKLQREYSLMNENVETKVKNLNDLSKERHETAMKENDKVWDWIKWQAQSDLEELRQRRLKDAENKTSQLRNEILKSQEAAPVTKR